MLDAETYQWSESCSLNVSRFLSGSAVLRSPSSPSGRQNEVIYVVGGVGSDGILSSVEVREQKNSPARPILEEYIFMLTVYLIEQWLSNYYDQRPSFHKLKAYAPCFYYNINYGYGTIYTGKYLKSYLVKAFLLALIRPGSSERPFRPCFKKHVKGFNYEFPKWSEFSKQAFWVGLRPIAE